MENLKLFQRQSQGKVYWSKRDWITFIDAIYTDVLQNEELLLLSNRLKYEDRAPNDREKYFIISKIEGLYLSNNVSIIDIYRDIQTLSYKNSLRRLSIDVVSRIFENGEEFIIKSSDGSIELTGAQVAGQVPSMTYRYWSPSCLYQNGKTFLVFPSIPNLKPYGQVRMTLFDKDAGFDRVYNVGQVNSGPETHQLPAFIFDDNGAMNVLQENVHTS